MWTIRSSSVCPITRARSPPSRISLSITTSPARSWPRAWTMFMASLSMTSWPCSRVSMPTSGETATRSLRPPVKMSTLCSSTASRKTP